MIAQTPLAIAPELTDGLPLVITPSPHPQSASDRAELLADPGFGNSFTDHMITVRWSRDAGWHDAALSAYAPMQLDPAAVVLQYAQSIFEGLKAYRHADGTIAMFRPEANAERFARSAHRLAMPELPAEAFVAACDALVTIDSAWVPSTPGMSLYLRPFMIASEATLVVRPSNEYVFYVVASPAGGYFHGATSGVSVYAGEEYVRAAPGGTGEAKCSGNYAASLLAQQEAAARGCQQVVWLDAAERRYVEEAGTMNLFFVFGSGDDAELVTPSLTGTLLDGVTRRSLIEVARDLGHRVTERRISLVEWRSGVADGSITETFACGTAAVVTPIFDVKAATGDFTIGAESGQLTEQLRAHLVAVQEGNAPDSHDWLHRLTS